MMSPDCHIESLFSVITYILETLELSDQKSLNKNIFLDNFKKHIDLIDRYKSNDAMSEGAVFDVGKRKEAIKTQIVEFLITCSPCWQQLWAQPRTFCRSPGKEGSVEVL